MLRPYLERAVLRPPRHPPEQRSLIRIPDVPAPENPLERPVPHRGAEHHVHGIAQRGIALGQHAHVAADGDRLWLDHESSYSPPAQGPLRDDVVTEGGVDTARPE